MSEDNETTEPTGLRKQLDDALAENKTLKRDLFSRDAGQVFDQYGLTTDQPVAKLALKTYDGDLNPDAFADWLAEQGFERSTETPNTQESQEQETPAGLTQRQEQQQKLQQLRDTSQSGTDQKVSSTDLMHLAKTDPAKAKQLLATPGAVELKHADH